MVTMIPVLAHPLARLMTARVAERPRTDALPEQLDYRDEGCDIFPSCLACPLPRCRYDVPGGVRTLLNRERDHQMRVLREDSGLSVDEIAERFEVSRRTVFRALHGLEVRVGAGR